MTETTGGPAPLMGPGPPVYPILLTILTYSVFVRLSLVELPTSRADDRVGYHEYLSREALDDEAAAPVIVGM